MKRLTLHHMASLLLVPSFLVGLCRGREVVCIHICRDPLVCRQVKCREIWPDQKTMAVPCSLDYVLSLGAAHQAQNTTTTCHSWSTVTFDKKALVIMVQGSHVVSSPALRHYYENDWLLLSTNSFLPPTPCSCVRMTSSRPCLTHS